MLGSKIAWARFETCEDILVQYETSLTADFEQRDALPPTEVPPGEWGCCGIWGPPANRFPAVSAPGSFDRVQWSRDRVLAVAKKYLGLKYVRSHIPQRGGFDCSNFTAWVYNYGLGLAFTSNVEEQSVRVGRRLQADEPFAPGDLIFLWSQKVPNRIGHVVIHVDADHIVHSSDHGVALDPRRPGYYERFAWARRVIE